MTTPTATRDSVTDPHWTVAGRFLDCLASRDFDGVADCLDPMVRFRALIPPAQLEIDGPAGTAEKFRDWFGHWETFEVLDAEVGQIGPRLVLRWRLRTQSGGDPARVVEQHAFLTVDDRVVNFDLMCSGFQSE
jgi:ketosteroid isomerase-like protein